MWPAATGAVTSAFTSPRVGTAIHGGVPMNVDSSYLDGSGRRVPASRARPSPRIPDGAYVQVAGSQAIYRIAGGVPLYVSPQYWSTLGPQPLTVIT